MVVIAWTPAPEGEQAAMGSTEAPTRCRGSYRALVLGEATVAKFENERK